MDDASRKARQLIADTPHLTLATADASGKPWSCPVYFAHDQAFTLTAYTCHDAAEIVHGQHVDVRVKVTLQPDG